MLPIVADCVSFSIQSASSGLVAIISRWIAVKSPR